MYKTQIFEFHYTVNIEKSGTPGRGEGGANAPPENFNHLNFSNI